MIRLSLLSWLHSIVGALALSACAGGPGVVGAPLAGSDAGTPPNCSSAATGCVTPEGGPPAGPAARFAGRWSPTGGTGDETCTDGETAPLPPNSNAVITVTQTGPDTLQAAGASNASSCIVTLLVSGDEASLAPVGQECPVPDSDIVAVYDTMNFTMTASSKGADTMAWNFGSQIKEPSKTCTVSLAYSLARVP